MYGSSKKGHLALSVAFFLYHDTRMPTHSNHRATPTSEVHENWTSSGGESQFRSVRAPVIFWTCTAPTSTASHQAPLAQLVERGTSNAEVAGSTPSGGSIVYIFLHDYVKHEVVEKKFFFAGIVCKGVVQAKPAQTYIKLCISSGSGGLGFGVTATERRWPVARSSKISLVPKTAVHFRFSRIALSR